MRKLISFDEHLLGIAKKSEDLADEFGKLHFMVEAIKTYQEESTTNREIFFASIGKLQRKINELMELEQYIKT